ncbi:MAG: hypothetical protein ABIR16_00535 [Dokdonella sp.]
MLHLLFSLFFAAIALGCTQPRSDTKTSMESAAVPPYTLERFRDDAKVVDGIETLVVDNPYGEITVRQTNASAIAWQGVEQRIGNKPRIARIEPFQEGKRQGVRIRYPGINPSAPVNPREGRVDLYVFVPRGHKLDLSSDFGNIMVRKIEDDVRARSRTGMIVVANRGSFDLESQSGELRAFSMEGLGDAPSRMQTSGNILVDVPIFDDIAMQATSAGEFRSEVKLDSQIVDASGVTRATFAHGNKKHRLILQGGQSVILQTLNKPIPNDNGADD